MGVKSETYLQRSIQKLIETRGGYVIKQHGSMISEPGVPDLLCCFKGIFVALECKETGNTPTKQQGIHCRLIKKAGGITAIVYTKENVISILNQIDDMYKQNFNNWPTTVLHIKNIDDGTRW